MDGQFNKYLKKMKNQISITLAILFFLFICGGNAKAQTQDTQIHTPVWLTLGLGGGSNGFTTTASLNLDIHNYLLTMEVLGSSTSNPTELFPGGDYTNFSSFRFCLGRIFPAQSDDILFSVSMGLSTSTVSYYNEKAGAGFIWDQS